MTENWLVWILLSPLLGAAASLTGKLVKPGSRLPCVLGTVSLILPGVILAMFARRVMSGEILQYSLGGWPEPFGIALILDGTAWISAALTGVIALAVAVFSLGNHRYGSNFFFFLLMMVTGMYGVAITGDLFTMFVFFEIIAVSVYVLIAWEGTATGLAASLKYLLLSTTGILFFLLGIFLIYRDLGVLSISQVAASLQGAGNTPAMHLALACLCVGIGVRTAFIPFHTWLPEAHAYAPHPISAILSGAMIKVSFFAMVRIILQFHGEYLFELLMWIGAITALAAVLSALAQSDVKRLLAYSSISQLGYILAVFGAGSSIALTASFFHAVNHALFKSLLFLTAGAAISCTGQRNLYRIRGLGRKMPVFAAAFFIGTLAITGIPPFNGFASKAFITMGMKNSPAYPLLWVTGILTIATFIKLGRIFIPSRNTEETEQGRLPGRLETVSVTVLALACTATGIFWRPIAGYLHEMLYGSALQNAPELFSWSGMLKVIPALILGTAVFGLVTTNRGKAVSTRIKALAPELRTVLVFFFAGLLAFAAAAS